MKLNNRELALLIWIVIFVLGVIIYPKTRNTIPKLLRAAFELKLSVIYGIMAAYTIAVVYFLYRLELWDSSQIKNTILWFLTVGLVSLSDITKSNQISYFKKTTLDIFSLTAIIQFVIGVYTFNFIAEFILVPVAAIISVMIAVAGTNPRYALVKKLLNRVLVFGGLCIIGLTIYRIVTDLKTFASKGTLSDFLIPGALSFMFLPLVYALSIYAARESAFFGLDRVLKPRLLRLAKWYTLIHFTFNKEDLSRWKRFALLRNIDGKKELRSSIRFIKYLKKIEKNPPSITAEAGWSPYKAKDALLQEGIITLHYQPTSEGEWLASSNYLKIDDDLLANNIAYYVEGDCLAAKKLKLVLHVNDPTKAKRAHAKMLNCATVLCQFAINKEIPKALSDALIRGRNKEVWFNKIHISTSKNLWLGHRLKGYNLNLTISLTETAGTI